MRSASLHRFIRLAVLAITVAAAATPVYAQGSGYWHTSGNLLLDTNNAKVRIAGINWYGFETTDAVAHGLTSQDYKAVLQTVKSNGYNTVRIPLSNQMLETPGTSLNISYYNSTGPINTDLQGLNSLQVLDKIIIEAGTLGLKVILDNHRSEAGNSAESNGLWYTATYPESAWIADWTMLAKRYLYNSTVIGFDLRNEPHNANSGGACWDCGGANDWHLAAERAGNAVLAINPDLLIFVEGTDAYNNDFYWWGGNLEGVAKSPVMLSVPNQLVYSAHDYGPHEYAQSWFNGSTTYASLSAVWDAHWAYISQNNLAPVWLGEFGTTNTATDIQGTGAGSQGQWFQSLVNFLNNDTTLNWTYWALNGEDSYGLLDNNYDATPASALKQSTLTPIQFALGTGITTAYPPSPATGLTAAATSSSQINLAWTASPTAGSYYTVYFGTSPSTISTVLASGLTSATYSATSLNASTTYYFTVTATGSGGTSGVSNTAMATTQAAAAATPPSAPSGLAATAVSSSQIDVSWLPSTTAGVTYTLFNGSNTVASGIAGTSYSVNGLAASTAYSFTVVAVNANGTSPASNAAVATTQAATQTTTASPSGLSASAASQSQINLAWQPSFTQNATYTIYVGTSASTITTVMNSGQQNTNFVANGLQSGTTYYFTVVATAAGSASAASNIASSTTQSAPATPPTNVAATAVSSSEIDLTWTAVTSPGVTYNVYVGTSSGATNTLLASGVSGTTYQATALTTATTYYFTLRGVSTSGTSSPSNQATATTLAGSVGPPAPPTQPTAPTAPSGLTATATSSSQINLAWQPSSTASVTYTLNSGASVIASGLTGTSYAATGLVPNTAYSFTVVAVSSGGTSAASNVATATTQTAAAGPCHVDYTVLNDWGAGFTNSITIRNNGSTAWTAWTLTWSFAGNQQVYQSWNGDYAQTGSNVSIVNASWNGSVAAGATVTGIGFNANYSGTNVAPTTFYINGQACK